MSLSPEDQGRANFYGLLSRLFYGPPDAALLAALAQADDLEADDKTIAARWTELATAAASADAEALREEYEAVFIGTGKALVTLYTSAYSIKYTNETPLVTLRAELAALGLVRRDEVGEPEDHVAALCDTMRFLITERELPEQRRFFIRWIQPIADPLCNAIEQNEKTAFYKTISRLAKAFFSLEQSGFEML